MASARKTTTGSFAARSPHAQAGGSGQSFQLEEATIASVHAAFRAGTHAMVRQVHAAGLAAGGSDEGAPGFRDDYGAHFYVGYLRDPLGNKLAIFCADPAEGRRGG